MAIPQLLATPNSSSLTFAWLLSHGTILILWQPFWLFLLSLSFHTLKQEHLLQCCAFLSLSSAILGDFPYHLHINDSHLPQIIFPSATSLFSFIVIFWIAGWERHLEGLPNISSLTNPKQNLNFPHAASSFWIYVSFKWDYRSPRCLESTLN